jgi:hypothetical protein
VTNVAQSATQRQDRDRLRWSARYARPVLGGLQLVVVLAGIRAAGPADTGKGPWQADALALAGAFEVVLAALLVALWLISRRRGRPGYPAGLLRTALWRVIPAGMLVVAVLAAVSRLRPNPVRRPSTPVRPVPRPSAPQSVKTTAGENAGSVTYLLYALLALLLLAAIVACVLILLRRAPAGPAADLLLPEDEDSTLRDAVESGRRALRTFDDAQAAIIACYVAMESSLARAGTARAAAETPDELLARAVGSGLLRGGAAGRLTELFYEARYSSHALPATARDEAARALDAISAELASRERDSSLAGTSAPGGTA